MRWKLNLAINSSGKMSRRAGHAALSFGARSDNPDAVANWDHHRQGATREPITLLSEITSPNNFRYLFDGTSSRVSWMDNNTSEWHDIITDGAADSRWQIASLRDRVVLTNNVGEPRVHTLGATTQATTIAELQGVGISKAKVVVNYQNVMVLMNLEGKEFVNNVPTGSATRLSNRIQWSDFRNAESWALGGDSVAGFQDLDDGEQILNAAELGGVLYVFTDRAIWRMFPNVTDTSIFGFHRWYSEPKNRTACLAYENALVATGKEFFWFGRTSIYWMNQFSSTPISPDWLLRASGLVFEGDERLDPDYCASPVGGFVPDAAGSAKEVWFSYPRLTAENGINDYSIVLSFNTDSTVSPYTTADYVDAGFTAFTTFSRTTEAGVTCSTNPIFIGAFGEDYCLKEIGGVFRRDIVTLVDDDVTNDIPDLSHSVTVRGYFSQMLFMCPFPFEHRDKILRTVTLSHDTRDDISATPNQVNLRIGNSYHLADPLATGPRCSVQWHQIDPKDLQCPDVDTQEQMVEDGTRPDDATSWENQAEQGRFLYIDLKVQSFTGTAPTGSDSAWNNLSMDYLTLP